jgi:deoxyribose-phosphate aldolase
MELKELLSHVDHTLLKPESTWPQIKEIVDEGIVYGAASVCIPPAFVRRAHAYAQGKVNICTVIGFPNGYATTAVKVFETLDAVENGADEIDMVINIGMVKERRFDDVRSEIEAVRSACPGRILKVIIETCLLTDAEKECLCAITGEAGADYIKTSTGFSKAGATRADVALMHRCAPDTLKVKAAGGIRTIADAEDFIRLGADRLGTSSIIKGLQSN